MAKPSVDGLEQEMGQTMYFTRVNIREPNGQSVAQKYKVNVVPTFIVLDGDGNVIYRRSGGRPDGDEIRAKLEQAKSGQAGG